MATRQLQLTKQTQIRLGDTIRWKVHQVFPIQAVIQVAQAVQAIRVRLVQAVRVVRAVVVATNFIAKVWQTH